MSSAPDFWMAHLREGIEQLKIIPLWGSAPDIPWEDLSAALADTLNVSSVSITPNAPERHPHDQLLAGFEETAHILSLSLTPIPSEVFWVFSKKGIKELTALLTSDEGKGFSDEGVQEGYYLFVILKALEILNQKECFEDLKVGLNERATLPKEDALGIDLSIKMDTHQFWGRLIVPNLFQQAFKNHFAERPQPLITPQTAQINIPVQLEVGSAVVGQADFQAIKTGDVLLLDRCTFDPSSHRGTATLVVGKTPLFQLRLKEGEAKILEHAYYNEEHAMKEGTPANRTSEEEANEEEPLWSAKNGEEEHSEQLIKGTDIPLHITVEIGRLQIPLEKLAQLEPGNVLELGMNPGLGVYLTAGGNRVAKGELVKLGQALGVKILSVGK